MEQNPDATFIGVTNLQSGHAGDRDRFISNMSVQISHVLDNPIDIWQEYGVHSQPSMVFVAADGTFERYSGHLEPPDLLDRANELFGAAM